MPLEYYRRYPVGKVKKRILRKNIKNNVSSLPLCIVPYYLCWLEKKFEDSLKDIFDNENEIEP